MVGQEDLFASLKAIMAAKRDELGDPPTPEELLAYRDGQLGPEEKERVEAKIAVYPDAARALTDLAAFPAVRPAAGAPALSAGDVGARWLAFRELLPKQSVPVASEKEAPPVAFSARPVHSHRPRPTWWLAAAALLAFVVGAGGGYLAGKRSPVGSASSINASIVELEPKEGGDIRSVAGAIEMPPTSEELVLVLRTRDLATYPDYELEIAGPGNLGAWSRRGLRPTPIGTFHLSFRRDSLKPGRYHLQLFGLEDRQRTPLDTYELRLDEGPADR